MDADLLSNRLGQLSCRIGLLIMMALAIFKAAQAKRVMVGNQMGWTNYDLKTFQVPDYVAWSSSAQILVGDEVVFKYDKGKHNVNLLPNKAAYDSCDFSKAKLLDAGGTGTYLWKPTSAGVYYFGCNRAVTDEGTDCGSGQKLALLVRASGGAGGGTELGAYNHNSTSAAAPAPAPSVVNHSHDGSGPLTNLATNKRVPASSSDSVSWRVSNLYHTCLMIMITAVVEFLM